MRLRAWIETESTDYRFEPVTAVGTGTSGVIDTVSDDGAFHIKFNTNLVGNNTEVILHAAGWLHEIADELRARIEAAQQSGDQMIADEPGQKPPAVGLPAEPAASVLPETTDEMIDKFDDWSRRPEDYESARDYFAGAINAVREIFLANMLEGVEE